MVVQKWGTLMKRSLFVEVCLHCYLKQQFFSEVTSLDYRVHVPSTVNVTDFFQFQNLVSNAKATH